MTKTEIEKKWCELEQRCKTCERCELSQTRTNVVFGSGSREARLMFVGEAPGEKEDLSGVPFVGAAGKLLDRFLCDVGIDRKDVFIANMLKCRPPKNRDPKESERTCVSSIFVNRLNSSIRKLSCVLAESLRKGL